jgi:hypothetical protein
MAGCRYARARTAALSVPHAHIEPPDALLLIAIDIGCDRVAGLPPGLEPRAVQRVLQGAAAHLQLAGSAAVLICPFRPLLGATKVRQHVAIAPARGALFLPALEILWVAAREHHSVDRRRAAQDLAARRVHPPAAERRLGLGVIAPVVLVHVHRNRQSRGHLNVERAVRAAVLKHQHGVRAVRAQAIGQHASRGARADDHIVKNFLAQARPRQ